MGKYVASEPRDEEGVFNNQAVWRCCLRRSLVKPAQLSKHFLEVCYYVVPHILVESVRSPSPVLFSRDLSLCGGGPSSADRLAAH